ncbi:putative nucleotidyltransferase [Candidatus Desulfosporosinus infrequens]|uniref:Putative nucleotidyltransferase n=1 Tax=Candidatus Desulfosporosinus infrequens TaxID=2043169 RepID=A0A2U3LL60_9FIRM|nr:putative nucleotidyltransferase [Candidatus Desulfosporosinus infrequens]
MEAMLNTPEYSDELENIKNTILNTIDADAIYLFGSYAYGIPSEDSDFDIYIVIPDGGIRPIEAMKMIGRAIYKEQKKPIDILVGRSSEFHQRKLLPTIERTVARDGVMLHGQNQHSQ